MPKKQERVPGTHELTPNRRQRRHPDHPAGEALPRETVPAEPHVHGPQDVSDPRAKSSGHKKKTADSWNQ